MTDVYYIKLVKMQVLQVSDFTKTSFTLTWAVRANGGPATLGLDAAAGGVFGLIGTAFGRVTGFFERREAHRQEKARWEHEYRLHELNMKSREQESRISGAGRVMGGIGGVYQSRCGLRPSKPLGD